MSKKKVVLAYSGGLDTSVILKWLQKTRDYDVIAMAADVGQGEDQLAGLEEKALNTGASQALIEDIRADLVENYIFPMLRAGCVYEGKYLLGTAIARPAIGKRLVEVAGKVGASAVAHGCTGKGNDQVRFELAVKALNPDLHIVAPWREWEIASRSDAMDYASKLGIPVNVTADKPYSIDCNLWHTSYEGGILEDPEMEPEPSMFKMTRSPFEAPDRPADVAITFEQGTPVAVNGEARAPVELLLELNRLAGEHAVGRADMVENRLVGMKSRGIYETPGGTLLAFAHRELEQLTLDRETYHFKEAVALQYARLIYDGLWFTPLRRALDAFVCQTQVNVTGTVDLKLFKGNIIVSGRRSPYTLYCRDTATFEGGALFDQKDAGGFISLYGLPLKIRRVLSRGWPGAREEVER